MKILHVVPTYLPARRYGGPINSVHGLCKSLARLGHEVHVFTTNVDGPLDSNVPIEQPVEIDGVKVWYFPSKRFRRLYWCPSMKKMLFEKINQFDLLHLHSIFLWPTWTAARMARRNGIPYLISPHGMLVQSLIRKKNHFLKWLWLRFIERENIENSVRLHATSELESEEAKRYSWELPPIAVIPNSVDEEILKSNGNSRPLLPTNVAGRKPLMLFLGRLNWKKGLDRLIPALSYIPGVHLVIAGNDEENYRHILEKLAGDIGVRNRITFTGPVYGEAKTALLKEADLFVLPSYSENFGNAVLEAMAVSCPVVVTPEVGLAKIVKEEDAGLVVDGNPATLGKSIRDLLNKPGLLEKMGRAGKITVQKYFTSDMVAEKMGRLYEEILMHET